jgi:ketosteroid isomerase-like protein
MSNRPPILLASLALTTLLVNRPGMAATSGGDIAAAETAIRKADADWAAAARTASVDGWMAFYSTDAIVLAPNVQIASDRQLVRQTVTSLLTLPHLSIAWHPIKVEVAASGDLAYLIGAYELRYDEASGARFSDRGKLLEIWRRQSDGSWKCSVDTWNSDGPGAAVAAPAAPATIPVGRLPAAVSESSSPAANSVTPPRSSVQALAADYGDMPTQYEEAVRQYFQMYLKDPDSVRYQEITKPERGYVTTVAGAIFTHEAHLKGWTVRATINARNSRGAYVGFKTYTFLFRGEKIVHTISPLAGGEMK